MGKYNSTCKLFKPIAEILTPADVHPKVEALLSQGQDHQIVFMEFTEDVLVPEHSHAAQWEYIFEGTVELVTPDGRHIYRKGDWFYLEAGVKHGALVKKGYKSMGVFAQKDRYKAKG